MSIFGNITRAIFGHSAKAATTSATPQSTPDTSAAATGKSMTTAEVEAMIAKLAEEHREKYDWRHSIVDLMKLLKLDSSLHARKELAKESWLYRQARWFSEDECLAAQGSYDQARQERWHRAEPHSGRKARTQTIRQA